MIDAIIFDFDGVILDSVAVKTRAFASLVAEHGPDAVERIVAYHEAHGGISRFHKFAWFYREVLGREASEAELTDLGKRFENLVFEELIAVPEIEGALKFIQKNQTRYEMFIASGTPQEELRAIVDHRNLTGFFKEVCGSPATKIEITEYLLKKYNLSRTETAFVGDAMTDYDAAQECGLPFIGIVTDAHAPFPPDTITLPSLLNLDEALH
ncbi:MAG: HAD hydrolase-like protein [Chthoniobacterales bacterium]